MIDNEKTRKTPVLRFKGFTDDWEQRKFSELVVTRRGLTYSPNDIRDNGVRVLRSSNIDEDRFSINENDVFVGATAVNIPTVCNGDILITSANGSSRLVGKHAIIDGIPDNSAVHGGFMLAGSARNPYFANALMSSSWYQKFISIFVAGGNGAIGNLNKNDLDEQLIMVPSKEEEQDTIGYYFRTLDSLITLHQRKYDMLKKVKKAMFEKMFPKNGKRVPEIRFAGFTDDWEQRKLGELATFTKGAGYSKSDLKESGTPVVLYGRLYTKYETVIRDVDTFVDAKDGSIYSRGGEVVVPASGETAEDIAIASTLEKSGILIGGDLNVIHPCNRLEPVFLAISISNGEPHVEMARRAQGKSVVHLHNEDLSRIELQYPEIEEQQKISQCFLNLDHLITLHQRKLEKLNKLKKSMLEEIFV